MNLKEHASITVALAVATASPVWAQSAPSPDARVSVYVTSAQRTPEAGGAATDVQIATAVTFKTPAVDAPGLDVGLDLRQTTYAGVERPQRVSFYNAYVGARLGDRGQFRVRAGHFWLPDLGTAGSLAGGLTEYTSAPSGAPHRMTVAAFAGAEPLGYESGYVPRVRKYGGYASVESGYLRRHVVGFVNVAQGGITQRSMLTVANYLPVGKSFFAYQSLEYDVRGPADGAATSGLAYFLLNARQSAGPRVELQGTYNRGRSLDARRLADDVLNGRAITPSDVDGLRYESARGRVSVTVAPRVKVSVSYARDRNNRDDATTGRVTVNGHATNLLGSGLDLSVSDARIDRPTGPYHSRYVSIGRPVGRSVYVSGDYSTSLATVHFMRRDGIVIETHPWSRRFSGSLSATLSRQLSLVTVVDFTKDADMRDLRVMTGLTYRVR
jgi:hypothetical protein